MDNEKTIGDEIAVDDSLSSDNATIDTPKPSSDAKSMLWKAAIGVAVVIIIGILAFPLFNRSPEVPVNDPAAALSEATDEELPPTDDPLPTEDNTAEGQFRLGNQFYEAGQLNKAVEAYQKAIALDPEYQGAYANLGVTYYQQQKFELAASQYEKALELNPQDGEVAYNLGALYLQQALTEGPSPDNDLLAKAVVQLQHALEISPDLAEPHFTLGVAYFFLEDKDKATEAFENYLARGSDPQAQQEAQNYLQQLNQ
ncbi:MAG: tetratricopeptide repeat protein [Anaerolineae bacterium]|nr:tetratricopeptide repeat protein [Anaerolineae bacterium]